MNGSAGLSQSRNRKQEGSTWSGYAANLKKECAGLVAGQAVRTAENRLHWLRRTCVPHMDPGERQGSVTGDFRDQPEFGMWFGIIMREFVSIHQIQGIQSCRSRHLSHGIAR